MLNKYYIIEQLKNNFLGNIRQNKPDFKCILIEQKNIRK